MKNYQIGNFCGFFSFVANSLAMWGAGHWKVAQA